MNNALVADIETVAYPLSVFDEVQRDYLLKWGETDEEKQELINKFPLYPVTAQIVAIGLYNPDTKKGEVMYQVQPATPLGASIPFQTQNDEFFSMYQMSEKEMLERFWATVPKYGTIVTFNGRGFDCPFLMIRSTMLGVKPTRNLSPYRYDWKLHCDLLDQLTFYGATRKFNLDFYCKAFGIPSPKTKDVKGTEVGKLFSEGKFREIAEYCAGDTIAEGELFKVWRGSLVF